MNIEDTNEWLIHNGWRHYPNQFRSYARCYYRRFDTPTRCHCNDDKEGMQIELAVTEHEGALSFEMEICGELQDGTWIKIHYYGLPKEVADAVALIPRMLATWEAVAGVDNPRA